VLLAVPPKGVPEDLTTISDVLLHIDYSASIQLAGLIKTLHAQNRVFAVARVDPALLALLSRYGTLEHFDNTHIYPRVEDAIEAFREDSSKRP